MIRLLQDDDEDEYLRGSAAIALVEIGAETKDTVPALIEGFYLDYDYVWAEAIANIGQEAIPLGGISE